MLCLFKVQKPDKRLFYVEFSYFRIPDTEDFVVVGRVQLLLSLSTPPRRQRRLERGGAPRAAGVAPAMKSCN